MTSATRKETTVKVILTRTSVRLVATLALAAPIAALLGNGQWH
jgi:hypothetical protein